MNTDSYAIYTFANPSATVNSQLESMAMGNNFIETVSIGGGSTSTTPMVLYSSENDAVPMGRYPIIVDPQYPDYTFACRSNKRTFIPAKP